MGKPFRPQDRVVVGTRWSSSATKFDLTGLDATQVAGLLRQWASAPYLRGEISRLERSCEGFARRYNASVNHLRNMLNGHRTSDYATLALVLTAMGAKHALPEDRINELITDALARSGDAKPKAGSITHNYEGLFAPEFFGWGDTGPSGSAKGDNMPNSHPDAALIRRVFAKTLRQHPLVLEYLAADPDRAGAKGLVAEVSVEVAESAQLAGAEGFVAPGVIAGRVWVPLDWKTSVYQRCGGVVAGAFVCSALETTPGGIVQMRAVTVEIEAGESALEWDLGFRDETGFVGRDGELGWGS